MIEPLMNAPFFSRRQLILLVLLCFTININLAAKLVAANQFINLKSAN